MELGLEEGEGGGVGHLLGRQLGVAVWPELCLPGAHPGVSLL